MGNYSAYAYIAIIWSIRYVAPVIILLVGLLFLALGFYYLSGTVFLLLLVDFVLLKRINNPKRITSNPVTSDYLLNKRSDILLLVSLENIAETSRNNSFSSQDWSFAWANLLLQEVGTFSVADTKNFAVNSQRVIILSKSVGDSLNESAIKKFQEFVKKGGILIAEKPSKNLEFLTGIITGSQIKARKISNLDENYREFSILKKMPLCTHIYGASFDKKLDNLMSIDKKPAILKRTYGKGVIITICFDFGMQLTGMQQGKPLDNFVVKDKTSLRGVCESQDLVMGTSLEHNDYPFADILEKFILEIISRAQPIPRLWYLKDNYSGALIITHDEDYFGDKMGYMVKHEKKIKSKSTFFITPSKRLSSEVADLLDDKNEFAIHWDRMPYSLHSLLKTKYDDEKELKSQIGQLESTYGKKIMSNRNHFLKWDDHYTNTFRILHKNNIKIDSSYGPNSGKGYLFGTSFPFFPLDTNGKVIPLIEMPFHTQELRQGVTADYVEKLIKENNEKYHGVIILLFHPQKSLPGKKSRHVWLRSYEIARNNNQWITNCKEFYEFLNNRKDAVLTSSFSSGKLNINVESDGKTIMIPIHFGIRSLRNIKIDGKKTNYFTVKIINCAYGLTKIPSGQHALEITYN